MKNLAIGCAMGVLLLWLPEPLFSQSATLQEASGTPKIHDALLKKIARDKQEVQAYRIGHVVVGRVQLDGM